MGKPDRGLLHRGSTQLFYVVDWLPPDFGAVGQYAAIYAREIAAAGRDVRLIGLTTGHHRTTREALANGRLLETTRLSSTVYQKSRYLNRLSWTIRTNLQLVWEVIRDRRSRRAEVVFTGAPPFMLFFVLLVKVIRRARLVYRITDFYPEVLIAELGRRSWLLSIERLAWFLRRRVDAFEVLGEDQRVLLIAGGIPLDRIYLKRDISPIEVRGDEEPVEPPASLKGRRVLLYSGNYSIAHDIATIVGGLIRHHKEGAGAFGLWLNATGGRASIVEQQLRDAGTPVARSQPGPLEDLPRLLVTADAHLISLRPEFSGIVLPSKVFGCIASRRPIVFVGPASSDVHLLCCEASLPAYERVDVGDLAGFAAALDRLARLDQRRDFANISAVRGYRRQSAATGR